MLGEVFRKFGLSNLQLTFKAIIIVFITDLYHKFHCFAFSSFIHMKTQDYVWNIKFTVYISLGKANSLSVMCINKFVEIIFLLGYWKVEFQFNTWKYLHSFLIFQIYLSEDCSFTLNKEAF